MPETLRYLCIVVVIVGGTLAGNALGWSTEATAHLSLGLFVALLLVFAVLDLPRRDDTEPPPDVG